MIKDKVIKPTSLRAYIWEYALIALAGAVITLFYMFNDLNTYIRRTQNETILKVTDALNKSSEINNQFLNQKRYNP